MDNNHKMDHNHNHNNPQQLKEGLEIGDLARLVHDELHIDEYKSKMGEDQDIVVLSFKLKGKAPAADLVNYIEKSYDWVLDADTSAGEMDDGDYIVFVEIERNSNVPNQIIEMLEGLVNLTEIELDDWRIFYQKNHTGHHADKTEIANLIPTDPVDYQARFGDTNHEELDQLRTAAGIPVTTKAPKNNFTESLRIAAGIK